MDMMPLQALSQGEARRLRGYARMVQYGEIGFAEAALRLMRADRLHCLWAPEVEWNPVHSMWTGGPEPRDDEFWTDRLLSAIDAEEAAEAAAEAPVDASFADALAELPRVLRKFFEDAIRFVESRQEWAARTAEIDAAFPEKGTRPRLRAIAAANTEMGRKYGRKWRAPGRRLLVKAAAGIGKTATTARLIAELSKTLGVLYFLGDKRQNAIDVADKIPGALTVRGRSAPDLLSTEGKKQCWRPEAAEAVARAGLEVGQTLCRNAKGTCPLFGLCGYQRDQAAQRSGEATVFAASNAYLTLPGPMKRPDVVVVDESPIAAMIGRLEFGLDRLLPTSMANWQAGGDLPAAIAFREAMARILAALTDGAGILAGLRARGFRVKADFEPTLRFLRGVEAADFGTGDLSPTMDDAEVIDRLERLAGSEVGLVRRMVAALQEEIELPRDEAHGVAFHPDKRVTVGKGAEARKERQARVSVHYRKRLDIADDLPVLVLDASGDIEIYRRLFGDRMEVKTVSAERRARFVQIMDTAMPTSSLLGVGPDSDGAVLTPAMKRAARLREEMAACANGLAVRHGGNFMLGTGEKVEAALLPLLKDNVLTGHFQNLRGSNAYEGCTAGMILGRNQPPTYTPEDMARALWSDDPEPLALLAQDEDASRRYGQETRHIVMRDGSRIPVLVDVHPDPRVQRVLEMHRERETEQAIDRLRLIHNGEPKTIYIVCNVPLDLTVDRVITLRAFIREATGRLDNGVQGKGRRMYGSRLAEAWQRSGGVLPEMPAVLARLYPDLWDAEKPDATKKAIQRELPAFIAQIAKRGEESADELGTLLNDISIVECPFAPARAVMFRVKGQGRLSRAWVRPHITDPAAALELSTQIGKPVTLAKGQPEAAQADAATLAPLPPAEPAEPQQEAPRVPPEPPPTFEQRARLARLALRLEDALEVRSDADARLRDHALPWMPGPALFATYRLMSLGGEALGRPRPS